MSSHRIASGAEPVSERRVQGPTPHPPPGTPPQPPPDPERPPPIEEPPRPMPVPPVEPPPAPVRDPPGPVLRGAAHLGMKDLLR